MERLEDFTGHWSLGRIVVHADGGRSKVVGSAVFRTDPEGLRYLEAGHMRHVPAQGRQVILSVRQRYLWSPAESGIAVRFDDGRPFHDLPVGQPICTAEHPCAPDLYRLSYDFSGWPEWRVVCRVTGPRKDYTMRTRYRPAPRNPLGRAAFPPMARFSVTPLP